jgi:creatinine amidohydrolase
MRRLDEMTSPEFAALDRARTVLLVPVGIVEEHGPHLPLQTDGIQAVWTCEAVAARVPDAVVAPLVAHGNASSTRNFPGTFSLSFDAVRALFRDLYREAARQGLRKIVVVSGHAGGGHMRAIKLAAEEALAEAPDLKVLVLSDYDLLARVPGSTVAGVAIPEWDGHAGAVETSRMLAIAPGLVKGRGAAHRVKFPPFRVEADAEKRFPTGVMGDPTIASEEIGHAANKIIVDALAPIVADLAKE